MSSKPAIVSEGGHFYVDLDNDDSPIWVNLLEYLESALPYYELNQIDKTLMAEFNAKWLRSNKRNILKFYSAADLEYFVLRFS